MEYTGFCKGCTASVQISSDEIENSLNKTSSDSKVRVVTKKKYSERLQHCFDCSALVYNTTCKYCGCLIRIKAKLINAKCPYPFDPKW